METAPGGPARFLKIQHIFVAVCSLLALVVGTTGFAWANKGVNVIVDGESLYVQTRADSVAEMLEGEGIRVAHGDLVSPALDEPLQDGATVLVRHSVPVVLAFSDRIVRLDVIGTTVAEALIAAGADPGDGMEISPSLDTALTPGMRVEATEVFFRIVQQECEVPFEVVTVQDPTLDYGVRRVKVEGAVGRVLRIWEVPVVGEREGRRVLKSERVITPAVDEVVSVGTKRGPRLLSARGSREVPPPPKEGRRLRVTATAYAPGVDGVDNWTATGRRAGYGIIAVDPRVIPLGTRIYVPGYGYGVAADTGGAIKGNRIDLCYDTGTEAINWGRRSVTITILP